MSHIGIMPTLESVDGYGFDLDGTVYLGDRLLPGAAKAIEALRAAGRRVVFATNNPLEAAAGYAQKLSRMGIPAQEADIVTALDALVSYLTNVHAGETVLTVAEPLVDLTLASTGFTITRRPERAGVVVVSFDRTFDYAKLEDAFRAVRNGAVVVATNPDAFCPTPEGGLPDCAAMLAAVEACTGATAEAIVGKPSDHMARTLLARLRIPASRAAFVGDRLATDVAMAQRAGMVSVLTLTGVTTANELADSDIQPGCVITSLLDLVKARGGVHQ